MLNANAIFLIAIRVLADKYPELDSTLLLETHTHTHTHTNTQISSPCTRDCQICDQINAVYLIRRQVSLISEGTKCTWASRPEVGD